MSRDDELEAAKQGEIDADNNNHDDVFYDVAHISYEDRDVRRASCVVHRASCAVRRAPCQHRHERYPRLRLHRQRHTLEQYESNQRAVERRYCREVDNRRDRGREWKSLAVTPFGAPAPPAIRA